MRFGRIAGVLLAPVVPSHHAAALADGHARASRDTCKVVTGAQTGCGALGFCGGTYMGTAHRTMNGGTHAIVRPTLGQAMDMALSACRAQARQPEACGVRLIFCADRSHTH